MIYKNVEIFNVAELTKGEYGMQTHRFPTSVEAALSEKGKEVNKSASGVEIRFRMLGDSVKLRLSLGSNAYLYRGSVLGGWQDFSYQIAGHGGSEIVIERMKNPERYWAVTESGNYPFSPEVVRIVCNNGTLQIIDVEGECEPPSAADLPKRTYLAYGSSITSGSLSLTKPSSFVSMVGEHFRTDVRNLGLAGAALVEKEVADHIAEMGARGEWDFATLCMGINCLTLPDEEIYRRVSYMIETVAGANPDKHIFCISPLYSNVDLNGGPSPGRWRRIIGELVEKYNSDKVHYINGLTLMDGAWGLSGDFVHPAPMGVRAIAENLIAAMEIYI